MVSSRAERQNETEPMMYSLSAFNVSTLGEDASVLKFDLKCI